MIHVPGGHNFQGGFEGDPNKCKATDNSGAVCTDSWQAHPADQRGVKPSAPSGGYADATAAKGQTGNIKRPKFEPSAEADA